MNFCYYIYKAVQALLINICITFYYAYLHYNANELLLMSEILQIINQSDASHSIVSSQQNIVQIVLHPKQSIYISQDFINFYSSNLTYSKKRGFLESIYKIMAPRLNTTLTNDSNENGYVGIGNGEGRIIAVNPTVLPNLCVGGNYLIAYTSNINITLKPIEDLDVRGTIYSLSHKLPISQNEFPFPEYAFLQGSPFVIEKMLGNNEAIEISPSCNILVHGENISIARNGRNKCIKGPGIVIFNAKSTKMEPIPYPMLRTFFSPLNMAIYIIAQVLMAYLIRQFRNMNV